MKGVTVVRDPPAPSARSKRRAPKPLRPGIKNPPWAELAGWRYWPDAAGLGLIASSLICVLAIFRPEGSLAGPLGRFLLLTFGWVAGLMPVWLLAGGALLISHRVSPRPWPRLRLGAGAVGTLCLLGLATLEAERRDGPFPESPAGGIIGRIVAHTLVDLLGAPSSGFILLALVIAAGFVITGVTPAQAARVAGRGVRGGVRAGLKGTAKARAQLGRPSLRINTLDEAVVVVKPPAAVPAVLAPPPPITETALQPDGSWKTPPMSIFQMRPSTELPAEELREQARIIEETLASFNIEARVLEANQGPAVTQFGIEPALGIPVSRIQARTNDLALRLGVTPIRIEAPVPGRRMVGIEVPNSSISVVNLREILESPAFDRAKHRIPLALGKDIGGKAKVADLARMPHLLIAGATGSGKSVCINSIVACILSQFAPNEMQLIMVDPKMVELVSYNGVPHLRMPVVTEMDKVVSTLKWVVREMERRYKLFVARSARNIEGYNRAIRNLPDEKPLPYLTLIIDELADLMMMAPDEVEKLLCRLAQLARATGIHLIVATQRPSVDVLTGLIKANFPTRIAFAVTSQVDSRVILDYGGAERLLGRGDMLFLPPDMSKPVRVQGAYVSDPEIDALVVYWRGLGPPQYDEADLADLEMLGRPEEPAGDEMYERAAALAQDTGRISVSFLQRRLGIGYPRAARLQDQLVEHGVIASDGRVGDST